MRLTTLGTGPGDILERGWTLSLELSALRSFDSTHGQLLNQTVAKEGDEKVGALPVPNIPLAAMIVEVLGTIHQLLLSLEEEAQSL